VNAELPIEMVEACDE
jgi:L-cysteate sulfo-lyase